MLVVPLCASPARYAVPILTVKAALSQCHSSPRAIPGLLWQAPRPGDRGEQHSATHTHRDTYTHT